MLRRFFILVTERGTHRMDNLLLTIVLAILFFLIGAGVAGYLAFNGASDGRH